MRCFCRNVTWNGFAALMALSWSMESAALAQQTKTSAPVREVRMPARGSEMDDASVEARLKQDVVYLASEELEGRGPRSQGLNLAAEYVARSFAESKLETKHLGGPYHEFRLFSSARRGVVESVGFARISGPDTPAEDQGANFDVKADDFTSLASSPAGTFSLPLVFAGYGITSESPSYDDYAGIDVRGKAVIILRHEPQQHVADSPFNGVANSRHAYVRAKVQNAKSHGAAAVILCTNQAEIDRPGHVDEAEKKSSGQPPEVDPLLQGDLNNGDATNGIPVLHMRRSMVEKLIQQSLGEELSTIESRIDSNLAPDSKELHGWKWNGTSQLVRSHRTFRNVVASLEGSGPHADETIIVGAHYDHLGRDGWGSLSLSDRGEIHYGADDNASGTSVLMEVARQLAARPERLGRRVLFIAFSAEELGLIGSKQYVQDPVIPLSQTIAMLNLDMVGRLRNGKLTVYGVETSKEWNGLLERTKQADSQFESLKLRLAAGGYGPSDHASFCEKGIPVLHFFTGFHDEYHRPTDVAELINPAGMRQIAAMVNQIVVQLANQEHRPSRNHGGEADDSMDLLAEEEMEEMATPPGPYIGIHVGADIAGEGVVIHRVMDGSPGAKSGLKIGDLITRVNDHPVHSAAEIRSIIQKSTPPGEWNVRLKRGEVVSEIVVRSAL